MHLFLLLPAGAAADPGDGCTVTIIQPQSAADKAGIHLGDILLEADGKSIGTMSDLHIAVTPVDGDFVMLVQRGDNVVKVKAEVHTTPGQPKLGIKCVPVKNTVDVSTPSPTPAAQPPHVETKDSTTPPDMLTEPLDCPFPLPKHAKAELTLDDGHTMSGTLVSCDPHEVTIRTGLTTATFTADHVVKLDLVP